MHAKTVHINARHKDSEIADLQEDFEKVKEKLRETRNVLSETAQHVKGRTEDFIGQSFQDMKDRSVDIQGDVVSYAKEHPVRTIGFAVLAGLLLSQLLLRK
jgi:ElaB/YqjD/DUF883 family membrane-anchored ribosome-binding protein